MYNFVFSNLKRATEKIQKNPQLIYTILVAFLITLAFVFMAQRFIGIATDAQERLVNVRIGSLQDAFVSFAGDKINDPAYLNKKITDVINTNETIINFRIISRKPIVDEVSGTISNAYVVIASNDLEEIGKIDSQVDFLYTLASGDPSHSITTVIESNRDRLFKTTRAIMDNKGNVLGVVMTTQTLSLADKVIENNINNSIILLIIVIVLIMLLFLRHSRIIDYMTLYKKLKEVDQLKDDFVSMASHELRTPLSIIRGYASIISEMPSLPLESKDPLAKIDIATKELDLLVADILDVSRIEQGKIPLNMETLNPSQILETVVSSFEIPAKEKGIQISLDRSGVKDNQFIYADKDRLRQIFLNIIGNAVKYTIVGEIKVKPYEEKGRLYIRISDTGIGMSAEEREHLFEKFYRIKAKETANVRGTGLGLWISDKLAKEMNGNISVESIKGVGSHFIIFFPIFSQS